MENKTYPLSLIKSIVIITETLEYSSYLSGPFLNNILAAHNTNYISGWEGFNVM